MVVIRNLPVEWTGADIVGNLNDKFVIKINFIKNKDGQKTGKAILHYKSAKEAKAIINTFNGFKFGNARLHLEPYEGNVASKYTEADTKMSNFQKWISSRVYIQNLSSEVTKDDIYALTRNLSDIKDVKFPLSEDGQNKGYSIVYLGSIEHVANVIRSLHNKEVLGKRLQVSSMLKAITPTIESRVVDKVEYVKYLKRKYSSTLKPVNLDHTPSLSAYIKEEGTKLANDQEREKEYKKLMSKQDQKLEAVAQLWALRYSQYLGN